MNIQGLELAIACTCLSLGAWVSLGKFGKAIELRILDHHTDSYSRFEVQKRSLGLWRWWSHIAAFKTEEDAIAHIQGLEDLYGRPQPTELYRSRVD